MNKCEQCGHELELCPANEPWNPEFWICPECDSTYVNEDHDKIYSLKSYQKFDLLRVLNNDYGTGLSRKERYLLNKIELKDLE